MQMKSRIVATAKIPFPPFKHGAVALSRQIMLDRLFFSINDERFVHEFPARRPRKSKPN